MTKHYHKSIVAHQIEMDGVALRNARTSGGSVVITLTGFCEAGILYLIKRMPDGSVNIAPFNG